MVTVWEVCSCGGSPRILCKCNFGEEIRVKSKCDKCGNVILDLYHLRYSGRRSISGQVHDNNEMKHIVKICECNLNVPDLETRHERCPDC